jgi:hypothetical protein
MGTKLKNEDYTYHLYTKVHTPYFIKEKYSYLALIQRLNELEQELMEFRANIKLLDEEPDYWNAEGSSAPCEIYIERVPSSKEPEPWKPKIEQKFLER